MDAVEDVIRLASCPDVGPKTFKKLKEHFGSVMEILSSSEKSLMAVDGIGEKMASQLVRAGDYDPRPEMEAAAEIGVDIIVQDSPDYPASLRSTFDPPILLYVKGKILPSDTIAIAIVGTRQASQYGRSQTDKFSSMLARTGFTIVSGLARGVDSFAHKGALAVNGRTIAVLGSGLANIYPEENCDIASEIVSSGALVSEFPVNTPPNRQNFPRRNRIIAGLSLGTLVIEAPNRSGSMITARFTNELGREVFALPGRIDNPNAEGCNRLIKDGQAKLVQNIEDILVELGPISDELKAKAEMTSTPEKDSLKNNSDDTRAATSGIESSEKEGKIMSVLSHDPLHIDEICARTGMPVNSVSAALMMLELKRKVQQQPGKFYIKKEL